MSFLKIAALLLVVCYVAEAYPADDDVVVKLARDSILSQQQKQQQKQQVHPHKKSPSKDDQPDVIAEKERIYFVPGKDNKPEDQVVVLEKETVLVFDSSENSEEKRLRDEPEHDHLDEADDEEEEESDSEHANHIGKSVFSDGAAGHLGQDKEEGAYCGGKPNEPVVDEEPELIKQINDFDAIAEAIIARRLANMERRSDEGKDAEPRKLNKKQIKKMRPSSLTADEARVWNKKLSEVIGKTINDKLPSRKRQEEQPLY